MMDSRGNLKNKNCRFINSIVYTYVFTHLCISSLVNGRKILPFPRSIASSVQYFIPLTCTNVLFLGLSVDVTIVKTIPNTSFSPNDANDKCGNYNRNYRFSSSYKICLKQTSMDIGCFFDSGKKRRPSLA